MKTRAIAVLTLYAAFTGLISFWMAKQSYRWLPPEAAAEAKLIDDLFSLFTGLGTLVFLGVLGPVLYSLLFHRASKYDPSDGPPIEGNTALEVIWTAVPVVLVLTLSFVSYQTYEKMNVQGPMELVHLHLPQVVEPAYAAPFDDSPQQEIEAALETAPPEEIEVIAKQWAWVFRYRDRSLTSTELHLPVDRRVRLTLHSEDVLHGFYVPAFRLKQDVVPNRDINFELTPIRTGTYRLRDSLFSGTYFAANQADIVVQSAEDYQQWLTAAAAQPPSPAYNVAAAEYDQAVKQPRFRGWKTIAPAAPPIVNYAPPQPPQSPPA